MNLEQELIRWIDAGLVADRSKVPLRPGVTVVAGAKNEKRNGDVTRFVQSVVRKYPYAKFVLSEHSPVEREAVVAAHALGARLRIMEPVKRGFWNSGVSLMDERIVAASTIVVLFDESARSDHYRKLGERQRKRVVSL